MPALRDDVGSANGRTLVEPLAVWQGALEECACAGFVHLSLGSSSDPDHRASREIKIPIPETLQVFSRVWAEPQSMPSQALARAARVVDPDLDMGAPAMAVLGALVDRAQHAAILWEEESVWRSPDRWGCMLQVDAARSGRVPEQIIPHQPAGEEAVALAEAASGFLLPASYTAFLRLTNGLGLDLQEHNSVTGCEGKSSHICSVMGRRPWMQSDRCGGLVAHP